MLLPYVSEKDLRIQDRDGWTVLHEAAASDIDPYLMRMIDEKNPMLQSIPANNGYLPLHVAASIGKVAALKILVESSDHESLKQIFETKLSGGRNILHLASMSGNSKAVEILLDAGALTESTDSESATSLHLASLLGFHEIVMMLLEKGRANPNVQNEDRSTPLHLACRKGHIDVVRLLLESSLESDSIGTSRESAPILYSESWDGFTPVHEAAESGSTECLELLFEYHEQIGKESTSNKKTYKILATLSAVDGVTPLHLAVQAASVGCVEIFLKELIQFGEGRDHIDHDGNTLWHISCQSNLEGLLTQLDPSVLVVQNFRNQVTKAIYSLRDCLNYFFEFFLLFVYVFVFDDKDSNYVFLFSKQNVLHSCAMSATGSYDCAVFVCSYLSQHDLPLLKKMLGEVDDEKYTCIAYAAENGFAQLLDLFLSYGGNIGDVGENIHPLFVSLLNSQVAATRTLVRKGAYLGPYGSDRRTVCFSQFIPTSDHFLYFSREKSNC